MEDTNSSVDVPDDNWGSSLLSRAQFEQMREQPEELLRLVEQIALDRVEAEKQTLMIDSEQEVYNLRQTSQQLMDERNELQTKLKEIQTQQQAQQSESEQGKVASKISVQQKVRISALEVELEALKAKYRSAAYSVETKASHIQFLEGMYHDQHLQYHSQTYLPVQSNYRN